MIKFFATTVLLLICISAAQAQTRSREAGLQTDNDSYLAQGSDRYYTNGLFLFYRYAAGVKSTGKLANKVFGFELGQKIFNPQSGSIPDLKYLDRPFAGYLYAGFSYNLLYKNEGSLKLGAQVGVIGPASKGEEAQEVIHKLFGFYDLMGWEYQIQNLAVINVSADYTKLLARTNSFDVSINGYANAGTAFVSTGAGPVFRAGTFNKLFNSVTTQSTATRVAGSTKNHELFFYYKPQYNYVFYDATIEGSMFGSFNGSLEESRISHNSIFSNQVGGVYSTDRWTFDLSATFHTKDIPEMAKAHQWGSLAVLYHFN